MPAPTVRSFVPCDRAEVQAPRRLGPYRRVIASRLFPSSPSLDLTLASPRSTTMTNAHVSDAPVLPFTAWYGLPQGRATCSLTAFSPPSLDIPESRSLHPATDKV